MQRKFILELPKPLLTLQTQSHSRSLSWLQIVSSVVTMARLGLVCLILGGMLMLQAMGDDKPEAKPFEGNADQDVETKEVADRPVSSLVESSVADESRKAEAPEARKTLRHRSPDKSLAGGGVIVGGLVTAIFAAVVCYIRVTRKGVHNDH